MNIKNEVQNKGREGGGFVWVLAIIWLITLYVPDPIPFIDEIGIPLVLLSSPKGRSAFIGVIIFALILSFFGLIPLGALA